MSLGHWNYLQGQRNFMATKRHKKATANEALKASTEARDIPGGRINSFCAFSWLNLSALTDV